MKLEAFSDKRGILIWSSPKILNFDYKYLTIGTIKKNHSRGGHFHRRISEMFLCVKGLLEIKLNKYTFILEEGDIISIPKGTMHIVKNIGNIEAFFVEFKSEEFNENDKDTHTP